MSDKKILFIANKCPPYRVPFFNRIAKKSDITFLFVNEEDKIADLESPQKILKGKGLGKYKIHPGVTSFIKEFDLVVFLPPDFSHLIDNIMMYVYCKIKKIPYIIWTERWRYKKVPLKDKFAEIFYRKMYLDARSMVVSGKRSYEYISSLKVKNKIFIAPDASEVLYDKKKIDKLKRQILKKYKLKNKKIILYVGRLISRKGINYLISAFSKLKDKNAILLIVGGGDFYNLGEKSIEFKLKEQVKKLNLEKKIIFVGEVNHSDTAAYYFLADVFVTPSITEKISEPWGLTLNEAMQFGLPVIATDAVGAAYDLIKNGKNGFMVKEKDSKELKKTIEKIINNEKLRNKMGKESLKIIKEKNNYEKMVEGFLEAIRSIK